jgi:hypothetical protein
LYVIRSEFWKEFEPAQEERIVKTVFQVLIGLALCAAVGYVLIYSSLPLFWEDEEPLQPHVYSLTWRSGVALVVLLAITQAISFIVFRLIFGRRSGGWSRSQ